MAGCSRGEDGGGARVVGMFVGFCRASLEQVYVFALCFVDCRMFQCRLCSPPRAEWGKSALLSHSVDARSKNVD